MRSRTEHDISGRAPSSEQLLATIARGRHDDVEGALRVIRGLLPVLETADDRQVLLIARWGEAELMRSAGAPSTDVVATCDLLEHAAQERLEPAWVAVARALRAGTRMDAGDVRASLADLARVDLDHLTDELSGPVGGQLLDLLALAYGRLRLHEQADDVRRRAEDFLSERCPIDRSMHWAHRAAELAARALEPIAAGMGEPDRRLLQQAAEVADQLSTIPPDLVPDRLRRGADAVRALEAGFGNRPAEALRLLGEDGYRAPEDLPALERQLAMIAGMHAQAQLGAVGTARDLDDDRLGGPASLPYLILDVCRARERLRLEMADDGDTAPVVERLIGLLVRLGWTGMDLVGETARQAFEHQALRLENRTDPLTGVGNRRALDEELRSMLRSRPLPVSLVLVDVDDFKLVNDRFTHVVGDEVLRRTAAALGGFLRTGDRLVRYGGDEFVVLLPLTNDAEAEAMAGRMGEAVGAVPWHEVAAGLTVQITTGTGTVWALSHRRPDGDAAQLFRLADENLLQAKQRRAAASGSEAGPGPETGPGQPARALPLRPRTNRPRATDEPPPSDGPAEEVTSLADLLDDPLGTGGRATAASLHLPFSPAGGLPLYQALLQDPPRVDPHLGLLPPVGLTPFTAPDAFTHPGPDEPAAQPGTDAGPPSPQQANKAANAEDAEDSPAVDGAGGTGDAADSPADSPDRFEDSEDEGAPGDEAAGDEGAPEPVVPRVRPRRRPNVIDLTDFEKRRSPSG